MPASPFSSPTPGSTVLGHPRIGPHRELKRALERYWSGADTAAALQHVAAGLRRDTWAELSAAGLDSVPSNTFAYYDQMLDAARLVGAVPERFRALGLDPLDELFAMARGRDGVAALELTKWFDTNYHYLVPELGPGTRLTLTDTKPVDEFREAREQGVTTRPVLVGPVTFLLLSKPASGAPAGFAPIDLLDDLLGVYETLLGDLAAAGAEWVQLDEPAFVTDRSAAELAALARAYARLGGLTGRPRILVASYFGELGPASPVLADAPIEAISLDLVAGSATGVAQAPGLRNKTVLAGVVEGRNVWRTDLNAALDAAAAVRDVAGHVEISTSCSLLHVPYDLDAEIALEPAVRDRLAFARQKVAEVVTLATALRDGRDAVAPAVAAAFARPPAAPGERNDEVRAQLAELGADHYGRGPAAARAAAQQARLQLPPLPTTTIGSFPQTTSIRTDRAAYRAGRLDDAAYAERMRAEIGRVVALQEELGLDVLVHGEPERNDMVQYFAENLAGFATTELGWVQSYGSRCVRPPILHGDVSRTEPITVGWSTYAQSLTSRPMKAMLTGPVTILAWSFVRADQPLGDTARQVGLALRAEVHDLEAAGLRIIQVDEPALRELLPLRRADRPAYVEWAVDSFRLAVGGVADATQIHTHLCYSEFGEVIGAIDNPEASTPTSPRWRRRGRRWRCSPSWPRVCRGASAPASTTCTPRRCPTSPRSSGCCTPPSSVWGRTGCGSTRTAV